MIYAKYQIIIKKMFKIFRNLFCNCLLFINALYLYGQLFFSFLKLFTYMSIHFRFSQSYHHNPHKILHLLVYHMLEVDHIHQQVVVILILLWRGSSQHYDTLQLRHLLIFIHDLGLRLFSWLGIIERLQRICPVILLSKFVAPSKYVKNS